MEQVILFKKPIEFYRAKIAGRWNYFESIPVPYHLAAHNYEARLDDKFLFSKALHEAGIPAPIARTVGSFGAAKKAFDSLSQPVIIKPRNGSRGRHTTTHIKTEAELKAAYDLCRKIAVSMVVEEHFFGSVYRGTVIGGKLVGFFKASPPQVLGDGKHTIAELVELKNKTRPQTLGDIKISEDTTSFLSRLGLTTESVLAKGKIIDLSAKTGRFYGGYTREMLPEVHPELASYFEKAAEVAGAPVVGFDAIMEDPTKSPASQRWGIIEGNSLPFIDLHYYAFENGGLDLAPLVWDLWS